MRIPIRIFIVSLMIGRETEQFAIVFVVGIA